MTYSVKQIATALGAQAFGAVDVLVDGAAEPASAGPTDLALAMSPAYGDQLAIGRARAAVIWPGADWEALGLEAAIVAPRARLAMAQLTQMLDVPFAQDGIHPTAIIATDAVVGAGVGIGPFVVVGAGAQIGDGTQIGPHVTIAAGVRIGAANQLHAGVRLAANVRLGDRVILQSNVVIGGDGFSFVTAEVSNVEIGRKTLGKTPFEPPQDATQHRIHSLGGVEIGDDVEVGANSTVDAGTIRATRVGRGSKIDNLVQIGHNVVIGEDCLLCAQTAIAGSSVIGDRVVLGGKSGVADNLSIGADCVIGGAAIILSNVLQGQFMMGYPAQQMQTYRAQQRVLRRGANK